MSEIVRHNCGIAVAHSLEDAYGILQGETHRGREAAGIGGIGYNRMDVVKWVGPLSRFDVKDLHKILPGNNYHTYFGHVRYATKGRKSVEEILNDAHPHVIGGEVINNGNHIIVLNADAMIVHNGEVEDRYLTTVPRENLRTECDSEALLHLFQDLTPAGVLRAVPGAYTVAVASNLYKDPFVIRDRTGIKPGKLGKLNGKYCVASEDVALQNLHADIIRDLEPGTIYFLDSRGGIQNKFVIAPKKQFCHFEYQYIAHDFSNLDGVPVMSVRQSHGEELANLFVPEDLDIISFVPRCPERAAREYATRAGLEDKFKPILYKMREERSFQGSTSTERALSLKENLFIIPAIRKNLEGKVVALFEDSTIRGNAAKTVAKLLKDAGVKKIYIINYTPKIGIIGKDGVPRGCTMGVDMPPDDDFIARKKTTEEISQELGVEMYFMPYENLMRSFSRKGIEKETLCTYCIGGPHPFGGLTDEIRDNHHT